MKLTRTAGIAFSILLTTLPAIQISAGNNRPDDLLLNDFIGTGIEKGSSGLTDSVNSDLLSIRLKGLTFIKNNEYFSPVTEGYTMPGFFFQPALVYTPSWKITLTAGTHQLKYAGTNKFSQFRPVFSLSYLLTNKIKLTLGTLGGSDSHQMYDPHFSSERRYTDWAEDGLQMTYNDDHIFNDLWLGWENYVFKGDSTREIFTFGESFRYKSAMINDRVFFEIPVQLQFKHFGGQISNYKEPVETFMNVAAGIRVSCLAGGTRNRLSAEYLQFLGNKLNGGPISGITKGHGSWSRVFWSWKSLEASAGYWKSHNFYSPNGNQLFSSISDYQPGVVLHNRSIVTGSVSIKVLPEKYFELYFSTETYYYTDMKRLDYAMTLHLDFDRLIRITGIRHR